VSREGLATAKAMCNGGMRADQVAKALCGLEEESAVMGARLILNELQGFIPEELIEEGYVYISRVCDPLVLFYIVKNSGLGAVFYGDRNDMVAELAELLSFPVIFVTETDENFEGENAILSTEKGVLYISPSLDVIDEFYRRTEQERGSAESFFKTQAASIVSLSGNLRCGDLIDLSELRCDEERLFSAYRRYAEGEGAKGLQVLLPRMSSEIFIGHLKAVLRAAVYGRIGVLCRISSERDIKDLQNILKQCSTELLAEEREFEKDIELGAVIDNLSGMLLLEEISDCCDFIVIDTDAISLEDEEERLLAVSRISKIAESDVCEKNKRVVLMGSGEIIRKALSNVRKDHINKFFLISLKKK